jgi:hypothetical protein
MHMTNGTHATYECKSAAAGEQNAWRQDAYRAECEAGSATVGFDQIVRIHRRRRGCGLVTEGVPAPQPPREGHARIVAKFLDCRSDVGLLPPIPHRLYFSRTVFPSVRIRVATANCLDRQAGNPTRRGLRAEIVALRRTAPLALAAGRNGASPCPRCRSAHEIRPMAHRLRDN